MKLRPETEPATLGNASKKQLEGIIQALLEQAENDTATIEKQAAEIKSKDAKIEALSYELAYLRRIRFAAKSEAFDHQQQDLFTDTVNEDEAAVEAELEQLSDKPAPKAKPKRPRAGRQPFPAHLPRIDIRHDLDVCQCVRCSRDLIIIREDITEKLNVEPAVFTVERHIRPQYGCTECETVTAAPIPAAVIDGGMATVGLLVWVIINKFADHMPLYRLEQIAARQQVVLSRATMASWVGKVGVALQPLLDRLAWHLLKGNTLHADETPVAQLDPGRGSTKKAYLWAYRSNDLEPGPRIIVFDFCAGRGGVNCRDFLGAWRGHLMVDDYSGYKASFNAKRMAVPCTELGCWAHGRRKFFDLYTATESPMAKEALERIGQLYAVEEEARDFSIDARKALRAEKSLPVLHDLHEWLVGVRANTANGGTSAKAIDYTLRRWDSYIRYAHTGHLPMDNNAVENCVRPIALGKNYVQSVIMWSNYLKPTARKTFHAADFA